MFGLNRKSTISGNSHNQLAWLLVLFALVSCSAVGVFSSELYTASGPVHLLTESNFEETVLNSDSIWIVEFYADWCGHCKNFASDYVKLAKALKGMVNVGAVESSQSKLMGKYGVKGFPTFKIFGPDKNKPIDYNKQRSGKAFVEAVTDLIKENAFASLGVKKSSKSGGSDSGKHKNDGDVVILTDDNFDSIAKNSDLPVFVKFFSPNCGHCRAMADDWRDTATKLKGKAIVAELDATVHSEKGSEHVTQGYPTIKLFFKNQVHEHMGGRSADELIQFVVEKTDIKLSSGTEDMELKALTSQEQFENDCLTKKLCLITFLAPLEDSSVEERKKLIKTLETVMKSDSIDTWAWFYTEGLVNEKFERAFGYVDAAYPMTLTIYPSKNAYVHMLKAPSEANLKQHISDLLASRVRIQHMPKKMPSFLKVSTLKDEL